LTAYRAQQEPHRFLKVDLRFDVEGTVPREAVERAIALSHDKYCSVWHSLNHDIDFQVTCDIRPEAS
jgi:putative redox protein